MNDMVLISGYSAAGRSFWHRRPSDSGLHPSDFLSEIERDNGNPGRTSAPRLAAGVLLPLLFRDRRPSGGSEAGTVRLSADQTLLAGLAARRSELPRRHAPPLLDRLLRPLADPRAPFDLRRPGAHICAPAGTRNPSASSPFFWRLPCANPGRRSGFPPAASAFSAHSPRTAWPVSGGRFSAGGFVENPRPPRPNREVEKIVEIPLASFFREELIGCYTLSGPDATEAGACRTAPLSLPHPSHPCRRGRDPLGGHLPHHRSIPRDRHGLSSPRLDEGPRDRQDAARRLSERNARHHRPDASLFP